MYGNFYETIPSGPEKFFFIISLICVYLPIDWKCRNEKWISLVSYYLLQIVYFAYHISMLKTFFTCVYLQKSIF